MADFKKLTVDGNTYNVKDAQARSDAASAQNTASAAYTAANLKMPLNGLFIGPVDSKATDSMDLGSTAPNSTTTLTAGTGALQSGISLTAAGVAAIKGNSNVTIDAGSNVIVSSAEIDVQTDSGEIYTDDNDIIIQADNYVKLNSIGGFALSNDEIIATRPWVQNNTISGTDPSPLPLNIPYNLRTVPDINAVKKTVTLVGGTVCWNQKIGPVNATTFNSTAVGSGGSISYSDGVGYMTVSQQYSYAGSSVSFEIGHVILISAKIKTTTLTDKIALAVTGQSPAADVMCVKTANWQTLTKIFVASSSPRVFMISDRRSSDWDEVQFKECMFFDLTEMFGSTIADYIKTLEQNNTGDGLAWFKALFPRDYYAYNAGTLYSVNPDKSITKNADQSESRSYELNHPTLHGLFKLNGNNNRLYCDGDTYDHDGTVTRNYEYRAYQAGDESLPDAITDGTHTVVKLVTPTTEQISTFEEVMTVYPDGTEALTDYAYTQGQRDVEIPVGNNTRYVRNVIAVPVAPITPGIYHLSAQVGYDGNTYYVWEV